MSQKNNVCYNKNIYVTLTRPLFLLYWQIKSPRPGLLKQDNNYVNQYINIGLHVMNRKLYAGLNETIK
jgi:hypothetical protein